MNGGGGHHGGGSHGGSPHGGGFGGHQPPHGGGMYGPPPRRGMYDGRWYHRPRYYRRGGCLYSLLGIFLFPVALLILAAMFF